MARMTREERASSYLNRLINSKNPKLELEAILTELNSLINAQTKKPLTTEEKLLIIEELERQAKSSGILRKGMGLESRDKFERTITASDNSDILEVISAMKRRTEK